MKTRKKIVSLDPNRLLIAFLVVNALILDAVILSRLASGSREVLGESTTGGGCPQACISLINQSKGAGKTTAAKEYYIPLGQGTGSSADWADVPGVQAYIDSTQYGTIKQATVETTVQVPTGNQTVWVRLVNSTDGRRVWGTEQSMDGIGPTTLTSPAVTLDYGNKLYKIQMKTQLKYKANVTQSRVHIVTQ